MYILRYALLYVNFSFADGEDWLETNCWYMEGPLPEGPPDGPFAGVHLC